MQTVLSLIDFNQKMEGHEHVALFMHNPEDESSRCAFRSITEANYLSQTTAVYIADVSQVPDIHTFYQITSTPSLLFFVNGKLVKTVSGCHESDYLKALMNNSNL
jgi:hypothetical protein